MKRVLILVFAAFLGACASLGTKDYNAMAQDRKTPSYFAGTETGAAFKLNSFIRDTPLEGLLIVKKSSDGDFSVKIMGPLGANIVDAVLSGDDVSYNYVLPDINTGLIKSRFEKFIFALLSRPGEIKKARVEKDGTFTVKRDLGDSSFTYVYDGEGVYPSKMYSGGISMAFADYQAYNDGQLPYSLVYYDSLANVSLNLKLLSVK